MRRLVVLLGLTGAIGLLVREIAPDVRRYLKLREM
ncbi:MAG: DUF6893 family small protein [Acidimicrobiales bacterium]